MGKASRRKRRKIHPPSSGKRAGTSGPEKDLQSLAEAESPRHGEATAPIRRWLIAAELLALVVVVVLPYLSSLSNGFVYDDVVLIVGKPAPSSLSDALSVFTQPHHPSGLQYYRPLSALTISAQEAVWGDTPLPYHLFNVFLLAVAALVVRALLRSVPGAAGSRSLIAGAFALVFVVHPLVSSTVHAISGRDTLLAVIFMAGALWAFLRAGRWWFTVALVLFAASLLCKEQAVVLPLLFVLADSLLLSADSPSRPSTQTDWSAQTLAWARRYALVVLTTVGYFVVRAQVFGGATGGRSKALELALFDEPTRPVLSFFYSLQTIFAPTADLYYEPHLVAWWSPWRALVTVCAVVGLGFLVARWGKPCKRALLFWAGWGFVTLLPSANIVAQETHFAERYVVLPFLGVVGLAASLAGELWKRREFRTWVAGVVCLSLVAMGLLSQHRGRFFDNDYSFLTQWVKSDPSSYQARSSLSEYYRKRKQFEAAIPYEREALDLIHAALPEPLCIKRHFGLAEALSMSGHYEEAAAEYEEILRMKPSYSGARRLLNRVREKAQLAQRSQTWSQQGGLAEEDRARLLQGLSTAEHAGRPVWFASTRADPRSLQMMTEVEDVFLQAGWSVQGSEIVEFALKPGLFIFVADAEAPEYVRVLYRLLGNAGLPVTAFATDYREYSREMAQDNPGWNGFHLAPDQSYVIVIGRPVE